MLNVKRTNIFEIKEAIAVAFDKDEVGLKKYKDPINLMPVLTIADSVEDTVLKLKEYVAAEKAMIYFKVMEDEVLIGFFACYWDYKGSIYCLVSFGINKNYRLKNYMNEYFNLLKKTMLNRFYISLWSVNTRAIKWLKKNGLEECASRDYKGHNVTTLII